MQPRGMEAGLQILLHIFYISLQQETKAHKRRKIKGSTQSTHICSTGILQEASIILYNAIDK